MEWLALALGGMLFSSTANVIDKYLLENKVKNPYVPVIVDGVLALFFALVLFLFFPIASMDGITLVACIVSGALFTLVLIPYFKAVQSDEVSRIIPLFNLLPLLVLLVSVLFLGHVFSLIQYGGIILLLAGAIIISIRDIRKPRVGPGFFFAMLVVIIGTSNTLLVEHLVGNIDFITVFFYGRIGGFLAAIPLFLLNRKDFMYTVRSPTKSGLYVIILSEIVTLLGLFAFTIAISLEKATLVTAISYAQPVMVFILALILSFYFPKLINEKITRNDLIQKAVAVIFVTLGAILLG